MCVSLWCVCVCAHCHLFLLPAVTFEGVLSVPRWKRLSLLSDGWQLSRCCFVFSCEDVALQGTNVHIPLNSLLIRPQSQSWQRLIWGQKLSEHIFHAFLYLLIYCVRRYIVLIFGTVLLCTFVSPGFLIPFLSQSLSFGLHHVDTWTLSEAKS